MSIDFHFRSALTYGIRTANACLARRLESRGDEPLPHCVSRNDILLRLNALYAELLVGTERCSDPEGSDEELRASLRELARALQSKIFCEVMAADWDELAATMGSVLSSPSVPTAPAPHEDESTDPRAVYDRSARTAAIDLCEALFGAVRGSGSIDATPLFSSVMSKLHDGMAQWFRTHRL